MSQAGTAVWFARHESRLAWRDFVSMMTAGRRTRARKVAIGGDDAPIAASLEDTFLALVAEAAQAA